MATQLHLRAGPRLAGIAVVLLVMVACAAPAAPTAAPPTSAPAQPTSAPAQPTTAQATTAATTAATSAATQAATTAATTVATTAATAAPPTPTNTSAQATAAALATLPPSVEGKVVLWGWPTQITRSFDENGQDKFVERVKAETGIDVEVALVEQNDLSPKLKAALPAGTGPDILATDFDVMGPYWGFMENLNSYAEKEWGSDWRSKFTDTALSEMDLVSEIAKKPGQALYIPGNMQVLGWPYYWIKYFDQAGIKASDIKTFDDFIAVCGKLKAAGIQPMLGASHPANLVDWYQTLVEVAAPGKMELAERGKAKFNDPDMAKTFDLIVQIHKDCMQEGAIGADTGNVFNAFHRGEAAMIYTFTGTPWFGFLNVDDPQTRQNMRGAYGTFLFPQSKGLAATDGGVAMLSTSKNKDKAWEVIKWMVTGKNAERMAKEAGQPMAFKALTPGPTNTDFDKNLGQPLYNALTNGPNKFRRVLCVDVYNTLTKVIPGVVTGQISSQDAADEVQDTFDRACQQWVQQ